MSGSIDVNLTLVSQITNNTLQVGAGTTGGLASVSPTLGSLAGNVLIISILLILLGALFVLVFKPFELIAGFTKRFGKQGGRSTYK